MLQRLTNLNIPLCLCVCVCVCVCVCDMTFIHRERIFYQIISFVLFVCKCVLPPGDNPIAVNPLNAELNPICYLLALLAQNFLHVSRIRVKSLTLRLLMAYIYIYTYIYIHIYIYIYIYIWSAYS